MLKIIDKLDVFDQSTGLNSFLLLDVAPLNWCSWNTFTRNKTSGNVVLGYLMVPLIDRLGTVVSRMTVSRWPSQRQSRS
jgi:hypothetical protein